MTNFAIQFNGASSPTNTTSYIVLKNNGAILASLTNASGVFWFKTSFNSSTSGGSFYTERAASGNDIWGINILSGANAGKLQFTHRDDAGTFETITTSVAYNDNLSHFFAITKSGTSITMYVDDMTTSIASGTLTGGDTFTNAGLESWMGGDKGDNTDNYIGIMDGMFFYNIALNATQRIALKSGSSVPAGLIDSYPMDEGTGTTTADTAGSNNGVFNGISLPTWVSGIDPTSPLIYIASGNYSQPIITRTIIAY